MFVGLLTAVIVIALDQLSKYMILHFVLNKASMLVIAPFFNIVKAWNTGVSFSMFNDGGKFGVIALSVLALMIVFFLCKWLRSEKNKLVQVALGFIIGGAIGNVIDRLVNGAVFDFLDFYWGSKHWPAFNVADSFICIGAVVIIAHSFFVTSKKVEKGENK